ncbi:MAG: hypothetical protein HQL52_06470 [Magnetococcales bacterium]|nr:hypothetical protein [Magnetococcales bacterium]
MPYSDITGDIPLEEMPAWAKSHLEKLVWKKHDRSILLNRKILLHSLALGRQFLLNNQKAAGNFNYQYDFVSGRLDTDDNQVRQAGTTWGLALINQYDPTPTGLGALETALDFFGKNTHPGPAPGSLLITYPGMDKCDTGTVALVTLALIEYLRMDKGPNAMLSEGERQKFSERLDGHLAFLCYMHQDSGHFSKSLNLKSKKRHPRSSPYFDGEALLAMIKAARYLDRSELIPLIEESAMAMAKFYTHSQWQKKIDNTTTKGFFQWSCMAYWEYQDAGWKDADTFGDLLLSLAWWMIHSHRTLSRGKNTGYVFEGLIPALLVAKARNHEAAIHDLAHTIDIGLRKVTSWQVGGPLQRRNALLTSRPTFDPLAFGGIMNARQEPILRIDVVQHQMHSVVQALRHIYTAPPAKGTSSRVAS